MDKNVNQLWNELEGVIRREPQKSMLLAFAGGFFLCLLPLGKVIGILVRVLFVLFKPALLILGVVKFLEYAGFPVPISRDKAGLGVHESSLKKGNELDGSFNSHELLTQNGY